MQHLKLLFLLLLTIVARAATAQQSFVANIPSSVTANEPFQVMFQINNADGEHFSAPKFAPFEQLAPPSTQRSSSINFINGRSSSTSSTAYVYTLLARKAGNFTIGAATIVVNGRTLRTRPQKVVVVANNNAHASTNAAATMPRSNDYTQLQASDLYFRTSSSKTQVYEQEPIVVTYTMYCRGGVPLVDVLPTQKPNFKNFWTKELSVGSSIHPVAKRIRGEYFLVAPCLQYLLLPQQAGRITIPAANFDCSIDDIFSNSINRSSQPIAIQVKALPSPQPANFSGGVGHFSMKAAVMQKSIRSNDIATLRLTIEGRGNLMLIKAPSVEFPNDFDHYEVRTKDESKIINSAIEGAIHFDYNFVPRRAGKYTLPPIKFVYFDPASGKYETLSATLPEIDIAQGAKNNHTTLPESQLEPQTKLLPSIDGFGTSSWLTVGIALLAVMAVAGAIALAWRHLRKQKNNTEEQRQRYALRSAQTRLRQAQQHLEHNNASQFYDALAETLRSFLADKLRLSTSELTQQRIVDELRQRAVASGDIEECENLLKDCDFARFAPNPDHGALREHFDRAARLIAAIDSQI